MYISNESYKKYFKLILSNFNFRNCEKDKIMNCLTSIKVMNAIPEQQTIFCGYVSHFD